MSKYILSFNIEDWCKHLEIEADSPEEAENKLYAMTTEEIVNQGCMYGVFRITDLDIKEKKE